MDVTQSLRLPPYNPDITSWLNHIEATFAAFTGLTDQQKYHAVIVAIPTQVAAQVAPTLANLPEEGKYVAVKKALLRVLGQSQESHLHALENVVPHPCSWRAYKP